MRKLINVFPILTFAILLFMVGCEQVNSPNHEHSTDIITADGSTSEVHATGEIVYVDANSSASGDGSQSNPFDTIQEGVDHADAGDTVELLSDFTLSSQLTISKSLTLDGNGNIVFASFARNGDYSNNAAIGIIGTSGVTVSGITIDGANGDKLHGINVYESTGVVVSEVSIIDNDHTGLVVNGSEVTTHNVSTAGHGWHAMNVDLGTGVDGPATLTVTGTSSHAEPYPTPHIFIDDVTKDVTVFDVEGQYDIEESGNARAYFLVMEPKTKDDCMDGGFADYGFINQGQCIQFVNTGKDTR